MESLKLSHDVVQYKKVLVGLLLQSLTDVIGHHIELLGCLTLLEAIEIHPHVGGKVTMTFPLMLHICCSQTGQLGLAGLAAAARRSCLMSQL